MFRPGLGRCFLISFTNSLLSANIKKMRVKHSNTNLHMFCFCLFVLVFGSTQNERQRVAHIAQFILSNNLNDKAKVLRKVLLESRKTAETLCFFLTFFCWQIKYMRKQLDTFFVFWMANCRRRLAKEMNKIFLVVVIQMVCLFCYC